MCENLCPKKKETTFQQKTYLWWIVCSALVVKNTNSLLFISPMISEETFLDALFFLGLWKSVRVNSKLPLGDIPFHPVFNCTCFSICSIPSVSKRSDYSWQWIYALVPFSSDQWFQTQLPLHAFLLPPPDSPDH